MDPTAAAREGEGQHGAVDRRAAVRPARQVGEADRPEQLAGHQPDAADRGQQEHQPHRPVGDRQPHRSGRPWPVLPAARSASDAATLPSRGGRSSVSSRMTAAMKTTSRAAAPR